MRWLAMRLPRRFWPALYLSLAASVLSLVLAIVPDFSGVYDPTLAILTVTLIAVIWYTFLSFCAVFRVEESSLEYRVQQAKVDHTIEAYICNQSRTREIRFVWRLLIVRNGVIVSTGGTLAGDGSRPLRLRPGEVRSEPVRLAKLQPVPGAAYGSAIRAGEPEDAIARLDIAWRDDLGELGDLRPEYWFIDLHACAVRRYQDDEEAGQRWTSLSGPKAVKLIGAMRTIPRWGNLA